MLHLLRNEGQSIGQNLAPNVAIFVHGVSVSFLHKGTEFVLTQCKALNKQDLQEETLAFEASSSRIKGPSTSPARPKRLDA